MTRIIERINEWRADVAFNLWVYEARRAEEDSASGSRRGAVADFLLGPRAERR